MSRFLCPTLVGRDVELEALRAGLAAACTGRGGTVVLVGEAGSGKSRLVRECVRQAQRHAMWVLVGRAVDSPTPLAFRPLAEAVAPALRERGTADLDVPIPFRRALARIVPAWQADGGLSASPVLIGEGLLHLLRAVGVDGGRLLVLEDLHWADPETVDAVEYLADNLGDEPVLCVVTTRPDAHGAVPERLGALVVRGSAHLVEARPLAPSDVTRMAALSLGVRALPEGLDGLLALTDGLPLLVEELLSAAADAGALRRGADGWVFEAVGRPPIPVTIRGTVAQRVAQLDDTGRAVLGAAALLGRRFDVELLASMVGAGPDAVLAALRRAADLQLFVLEAGDVRFRHALTRDAVLDQLLPPERAALARSALVALRAASAELPELAAALHEEAGEPDIAAALLLEAGRREHTRGALRTAADVLGRARRLAAPPTSVEIDQELLRVLADAGRVDVALDVGERLLATLAPAPRRAQVHLLLARAAVAAGRWSSARARIARAREEGFASAPVDALSAQVELGCGALDEAVDLAERALANATETGHTVRCEALEVLGRVTRLRDVSEAREIFERQLAAAEDGALAVWRLRALHQLGTLDLLSGPVLDGMRRARAVAMDQGALAVAADIDLQIAANLAGGFRVDECLQLAQRCAELARRWRLGTVLAAAQVVAAYAHGLAGRRPEMELLLAETLAGDVDDDIRAMARGRCRGLLALLDEDHPRALRELDAAMDLVRGLRSPTLRPWFALWGILRTVQDREGGQARAEARRLTPIGARPLEALLDLADAVACGRAGDRRAATDLSRAAEAALAPVEECFAGYHQLARRLVAEAALADGWGEPVRWLTEAAVFFAEHSHHPPARACRQLLRRAGAPVPRKAPATRPVPETLRRFGLTEREHDVLRLIAAGRTSGQIADELVISRRTVDKHVERLLAKTGASRRADLRGLLPGPRT